MREARELVPHFTGGGWLQSSARVGVTAAWPAPIAYLPFGGGRDSFFGDLKVHGRDAFQFYTDG